MRRTEIVVYFLIAMFLAPAVWAQSEREARFWQVSPVPTGLERFFLEKVLGQFERALHGTDLHPRFDSINNLIIASRDFKGSPDIAFVCGVDEPTFIISGHRTGEYFGVRPLFFNALTPEFLRPWVGHPLMVVTVRGQAYPATFAIPSTHLHRGRRDAFWEGLREKDLYLDVGLPEGNEIDLLDRVVRRRTFDILPGGHWVGYQLGQRMSCYGLFELVLHAAREGIPGKVHFVFVTQSQFGHRGLQAYITQNQPGALVYFTARDGLDRVEIFDNGVPVKRPPLLLRRIRSGPTRPLTDRRELGRYLGRFSYGIEPVVKTLTERPLLVAVLPVERSVGDTEVISVDPDHPGSLPVFLKRVKSWFK